MFAPGERVSRREGSPRCSVLLFHEAKYEEFCTCAETILGKVEWINKCIFVSLESFPFPLSLYAFNQLTSDFALSCRIDDESDTYHNYFTSKDLTPEKVNVILSVHPDFYAISLFVSRNPSFENFQEDRFRASFPLLSEPPTPSGTHVGMFWIWQLVNYIVQ